MLRFLILVLLLTFPISAYAEENPYKATTVDECIQEKECVWYHFLLAVQENPNSNKPTKSINVKKWEKPVRLRVTREFSDYNYSKIEKDYIQQIAENFHQELTYDKKFNFLIAFSDDIEKDLSSEFGWIFEKLAGKNIPLIYYKSKPLDQKDQCYYFAIQHPKQGNSIYSYFAFIHRNNPNIPSCLKEAIYAGFGLSNVSDSAIWASYKKGKQYSNIEMLLLMILQRKEIKSGMTYNELKSAFDKAYPEVMDFVTTTGAFKKQEKAEP